MSAKLPLHPPPAPSAGEPRIARRRRVMERIEDVLAGGGLRVAYQPIVELAGGRVVGVEALARFPGGPGEPPGAWFEEAREVGLGVELELLALRTAIPSLGRLPEAAFLSINLSPEALASPRLRRLLPGLPCTRLVLEVTEHTPVRDYEPLAAPLREFREAGGRVAVDDMGAGYSSLRHILEFEPDLIKMEVRFARGIDADPARRALAAGVLALARELGSEVVAEGIETEDELRTLRALGVPYGQGFYLGRPGPLPPPGAAGAVAPLPQRRTEA